MPPGGRDCWLPHDFGCWTLLAARWWSGVDNNNNNNNNEYGLSQHDNEISRPASNNILDLISINNPSSISHVCCTPGMSDHNAVICVLNILPQYKRQPNRTISMCNKANLDDIRTETKHLSKLYIKRNPDICTVEDNCLFIQTSSENLMQTFVPSRLSKSKFHLSWITKDVRRQMKSRDKLYVKAIKSKSPQDLKRFKDETEYSPKSLYLHI